MNLPEESIGILLFTVNCNSFFFLNLSPKENKIKAKNKEKQ